MGKVENVNIKMKNCSVAKGDSIILIFYFKFLFSAIALRAMRLVIVVSPGECRQ